MAGVAWHAILVEERHLPKGVAMYRKILVPLDGSALAEIALAHARDLANDPSSQIVLVRVPVNILYDPTAVMPPSSSSMYDYVRAEAKSYLTRIERDLNAAGYNASSELCEGPVADAILECAERVGANLIVMSTHGRSGVARWLLGSVAEKIVRGAHLPVLLVRAPQGQPA